MRAAPPSRDAPGRAVGEGLPGGWPGDRGPGGLRPSSYRGVLKFIATLPNTVISDSYPPPFPCKPLLPSLWGAGGEENTELILVVRALRGEELGSGRGAECVWERVGPGASPDQLACSRPQSKVPDEPVRCKRLSSGSRVIKGHWMTRRSPHLQGGGFQSRGEQSKQCFPLKILTLRTLLQRP